MVNLNFDISISLINYINKPYYLDSIKKFQNYILGLKVILLVIECFYMFYFQQKFNYYQIQN